MENTKKSNSHRELSGGWQGLGVGVVGKKNGVILVKACKVSIIR
jgi:hypothetical protein